MEEKMENMEDTMVNKVDIIDMVNKKEYESLKKDLK
jgi:hypothetical protein